MIYSPEDCINQINSRLEHKTNGFSLNGEFHRFGTAKNYCWAVGQSWIFKGETYCIVKYGDWRDSGTNYTWKSWGDQKESRTFDKKMKEAMDIMIARSKEEESKKHRECREKWEPIYRAALQDPPHEYLRDKGIDDNFIARNFGKNLLVPAFNHNHFTGVQVISKDKKTFSTGIQKKGSFCPVVHIDSPEVIYFAEGYATACSIYLATRSMVICCFDCGNLKPVIQSFRDRYRDIPFIICADNDQWTEGNPGVKHANQASASIQNVEVIFPTFNNLETKPTDFNDLHVLEGIDVVKDQIIKKENSETTADQRFDHLRLSGFSYESNDGKVKRLPLALRDYFFHQFKHINCRDTKQTYIYNDGKYNPLADIEIECFAQKYYDPPLESTHQSKEFLNAVKRSRIANVELLRQVAGRHLICFKNGVLDYETMEFSPHSHKNLFFNQLPYNYDEDATCPVWDELLVNLSTGREVIVDVIEEFLGYIISGMEYRHNKVLILKGGGANGKSTLINAMGMVAGRNNCSYAQVSQMASNRFMTNDLKHKLVNFSEEDNPKKVFSDSSFIKLLTGNSSIRVEQKGQPSTSIINYAKIVLAYNELPFMTDFSEGMRRRLLIVPFDMDFIRFPQYKIKNLAEKLNNELPGIANRAITGLNNLIKNDDFTTIPETRDEINEIIKGSDTVREWWSECIKITNNENDRVALRDMFEDYKNIMNGQCRTTLIRFGKKIRDIVDDVSRTKEFVTYSNMRVASMMRVDVQKAVSGIKLEKF